MNTDDTIDMDGPEMMPLDDPDEGHALRDEDDPPPYRPRLGARDDEDCGPGSDGYDNEEG